MLSSQQRIFLLSSRDHIFVFEGNGNIKDFPGNYSDYRSWAIEQAKTSANSPIKTESKSQEKPRTERQPKLTFKERKELETLTTEIEQLTAEKQQLDNLFNSSQEIIDIIEKSNRYNEIKEILNEKEMRWLELSEKE